MRLKSAINCTCENKINRFETANYAGENERLICLKVPVILVRMR